MRPTTATKPKENADLSHSDDRGKATSSKLHPNDLNSSQLYLQKRLLDLRNQMKELMISNIFTPHGPISSTSEDILDPDLSLKSDFIISTQSIDPIIKKSLDTAGVAAATHQLPRDPPLSRVLCKDLITFNDLAVTESNNQDTRELNCLGMKCSPANSITARTHQPVLSPISLTKARGEEHLPL